MQAFTVKSDPRYLLMVFALAGDSTITSDLLISAYEELPATELQLSASILSIKRYQFLCLPRYILQRAFDSPDCIQDSLGLQFTDKILSRQLPDQSVHFELQECGQNARLRNPGGGNNIIHKKRLVNPQDFENRF